MWREIDLRHEIDKEISRDKTGNWKIGFGCAVVALALVIASLLLPWHFYEEDGSFSYSGYSGDYYKKQEFSLQSYKATADIDSSYYSDRSTKVYDYAEIEDDNPNVVQVWTVTFIFTLLALIAGIVSVITISFIALRKVSVDWRMAIAVLAFLAIFTPIFFAIAYPWACGEDSPTTEFKNVEVTNYEGSPIWGSCDVSYTFMSMNFNSHALWYHTWGWWLTLIAFPFALAAYYYTKHTKSQPLIGLKKGALGREEMLTSDEKLKLLEERLLRGDLSEEMYKELRQKYEKEKSLKETISERYEEKKTEEILRPKVGMISPPEYNPLNRAYECQYNAVCPKCSYEFTTLLFLKSKDEKSTKTRCSRCSCIFDVSLESAEESLPEPVHEAKLPEESEGLFRSFYQEVAKDFEKPIEPTFPFEEVKLIKVRCLTCKEIIEIKDIGQRPLEITCKKCGTKGILR